MNIILIGFLIGIGIMLVPVIFTIALYTFVFIVGFITRGVSTTYALITGKEV